ncbi:MAG: MBL fold metallo-hydrolase [Chloroflexota bacterium]|nr:MBL fold metallo-hydrolase [Chloroflexota bacterium]MDE2638212.1 MBL fold metallo-hydrolase [Chloroflexota bacterium]
MDIAWHGYSCFRITERGHTSVVTDPYRAKNRGGKFRLAADLVTVSHDRAKHCVEEVRDQQYVIAGPGEYEVGELFITGIALHHHDVEADTVRENVAYHFEYPNDLSVLHLGALRQLPEPSTFEQLDQVNVLLLPVEGAVLGGDQLADLISVIEPSYVVPMQPILLADSEFATAVESFLKVMGVSIEDEEDGLRVTPTSLPEQTQVALLSANHKPS